MALTNSEGLVVNSKLPLMVVVFESNCPLYRPGAVQHQVTIMQAIGALRGMTR